MVGTIAPTVRPIADAAKDSTVTIPQNFPNLESQNSKSVNHLMIKHISTSHHFIDNGLQVKSHIQILVKILIFSPQNVDTAVKSAQNG